MTILDIATPHLQYYFFFVPRQHVTQMFGTFYLFIFKVSKTNPILQIRAYVFESHLFETFAVKMAVTTVTTILLLFAGGSMRTRTHQMFTLCLPPCEECCSNKSLFKRLEK